MWVECEVIEFEEYEWLIWEGMWWCVLLLMFLLFLLFFDELCGFMCGVKICVGMFCKFMVLYCNGWCKLYGGLFIGLCIVEGKVWVVLNG